MGLFSYDRAIEGMSQTLFTLQKLAQVRPRLVMLCEQESSVDPGWLQNRRARKFKFRKMADIDIGNQVLCVGFCRQIYVLKTLALPWHFYMKRRPLERKKRLVRIQANKFVGLVIGLHPIISSILSKCLNVSRFFPGRFLLPFNFLYFF